MAIFREEMPYNSDVEVRYGYYMMISSMIFFVFVNGVVSFFGAPKSLRREDLWKWKNLLVSWVHAAIVTVWDLVGFLLYPDMFQDLLLYANYWQYYLLAFSTGYFTYDFLDMIYNKKIFKLWEVTLHHIAVLSTFWYSMHFRVAIAFSMLALLAEVNSFFLHSRKLLQMIQVNFDHLLYRIVTVCNIVTFFIFRGISLGSITYGMFKWYHRVTVVYYVWLGSAMVIMNIINPVFFWRLLQSDFLRKKKSPSVKQEEKIVVNGLGKNGFGNNNVKLNHAHSN